MRAGSKPACSSSNANAASSEGRYWASPAAGRYTSPTRKASPAASRSDATASPMSGALRERVCSSTPCSGCKGSSGATVAGGSSRSSGSFISRSIASSRKPSAPRSSQPQITSPMRAGTSGLRQLRSGCSGKNEWRYQRPLTSSRDQAGPPKAATQLLSGRSARK